MILFGAHLQFVDWRFGRCSGACCQLCAVARVSYDTILKCCE